MAFENFRIDLGEVLVNENTLLCLAGSLEKAPHRLLKVFSF